MARHRELVIVAFIDPPEVMDASITSIPARNSPALQVIASLPKSVYQLQIHNGVGLEFIGIYKGSPGQEVLVAGTGVQSETKTDVFIPKGSRVSIRSFGLAPITTGSLFIQFFGEY